MALLDDREAGLLEVARDARRRPELEAGGRVGAALARRLVGQRALQVAEHDVAAQLRAHAVEVAARVRRQGRRRPQHGVADRRQGDGAGRLGLGGRRRGRRRAGRSRPCRHPSRRRTSRPRPASRSARASEAVAGNHQQHQQSRGRDRRRRRTRARRRLRIARRCGWDPSRPRAGIIADRDDGAADRGGDRRGPRRAGRADVDAGRLRHHRPRGDESARDEAALQEYLGDGCGAAGAEVDVWEPRSRRRAGTRQIPARLELRRPAADGRPLRRRRAAAAACCSTATSTSCRRSRATAGRATPTPPRCATATCTAAAPAT